MLGVWSGPKDPLQVLAEFLEAPDHLETPLLKIGGAGQKWVDIENMVKQHRNKNRVILLGQLNTEQLALELQKSEGFLLPTSYETFSVITAEALCTGCPVITHAVGALPELLGHDWPGYKKPDESWLDAINRVSRSNLPMESLTHKTRALCSPEHVTQLYSAAITSQL
jgi:glycosyltransferase involved in cell wall biosynthesis